ncbi:FAD-dependent oxidoreductase [Streptomyces clavuligerus]|uniref:Monooxygenase n=1 Tax=Streptomyces clavuligerus TaxID=1901 RepID=E2PX93_STRCL|nr:FAD-dependent oxidoreductase [Streptomyces clavuligerus]ANW17353.1 pyridine nucleotide-disulfide oxidoreductase [Streptomyces clavuligerus]AXU16411.1 pyridine nucleotide-disulfide oxidoreductase [Streptomyces clavuligerus]EFG10170.1 Monooxygenase [Streptomyces clavuligerus]MBY6301744.1 FAD-dependent monooxygenase [Streptomyces clavuligerus]QCS04683.1 pyridine nucleotide-disulfide oxidoreductase [Streptomyces clavuligerus]
MTPPSRTASLPPRRAVVIGGGLAGMLAAAALDGLADEITVVERDALPAGPAPRKGLPQARHTHLLWSGGVRAFEELLPGITGHWLAAGARRVPLPTGLVSLWPQGWVRRWPEMQYMIVCSRDLLDWVVRERVLEQPAVTVLQAHTARGLVGTAERVRGVRVGGPDGQELTLGADLVVDACGRGSRAPVWLRDLGIGDIEEERVDSGLVYATRLYRAPAGSEGFPVVNVQSDPGRPVPGRTATLAPVEGGRWMVTLSGTRGGEPPADPEGFEAFARTATRHPVVGELISGVEPLPGGIVLSRSTVNRRYLYERAERWPDGFVAAGDSVATYNPVYGQGMSVAAQGLAALRGAVGRSRLDEPGLARRVQQVIARPVATAWSLATSQDILYPGAVGRQPHPCTGLAYRYVDRLAHAATGRARITRAFIDVITMSRPSASWLHPDIVVGALRGPGRRRLDGPPLTADELKIATGGGRADV